MRFYTKIFIILLSVIGLGIFIVFLHSTVKTTPSYPVRNAFFGVASNIQLHQPTNASHSNTLATTPLEQATRYLPTMSRNIIQNRTHADTSISPQQNTIFSTKLSTQRPSILSLFNSLIKSPPQKTSTTIPVIHTPDALLWNGIYSATTPVPTNTQAPSATQKALHTYGNQLGAVLKTFTTAQGDQIQLLKDFIANRKDTAPLKRLTTAYSTLAHTVGTLSAPSQLEATNSALSAGYKLISTRLWDITDAQTDKAFIQRLSTYNKAAAIVAEQQIKIINTFKEYNISFKSSEPGTLFMFSGSTL